MTVITPTIAATQTDREQVLRAAAEKLESQFLAEMLKSAGVGEPRESLGGGAGEDQFSSFLVQEYASATVRAGGIGLAKVIFESLVKKEALS